MYPNRLYRELSLITHVLQLRDNGMDTINTHCTDLPHTYRPLSIFLSLVFLWKKSSLLHLHSLILIHHWFFFTQNELFLTQKLCAQLFFKILHFLFRLYNLSPCLCSFVVLLYYFSPPSLPSLSLNNSIWPCQLHFHLHFLHPLHCHPSPILFIAAKVVADLALSLSSDVYVPLLWLSAPTGAAFHLKQDILYLYS